MSSDASPPKYDFSARICDSPQVRPALDDNWQARRELAAALRRLNGALLTADVATGQLQETTAQVLAAAERIEASPRIYGRKAHSERAVASGALDHADLLYELSPAVGWCNAVAPAMHIWHDGGRVHADVIMDWSYEGPFGLLHGGVIALIFDQVLGVGQRVDGKGGGRTATLSIRYHHPTPLNQPLHVVAELKRVDGRKKIMAAELWAGNVKTASCEGLFVTGKYRQPTGAAAADKP